MATSKSLQGRFEEFGNAVEASYDAIVDENGVGTEELPAVEALPDALVLEAKGQAGRFTALLAEYQRAPGVTRERLYLETMEKILPSVEKVVVEPGLVEVLPLWRQSGIGSVAPPSPMPHEARADEKATSSEKGRARQ